jgi:hypothetical protein
MGTRLLLDLATRYLQRVAEEFASEPMPLLVLDEPSSLSR